MMTAPRAAVQSILTGSAIVNSLGFGEVLAGNSVDSPPQARFLIVQWGTEEAQFGNRGRNRLTVWAHDTSRDYTEISKALREIQALMAAATHVSGADGVILTTALWRGESEDLFDSGYNTVTRYAEFDIVGRLG